MRKLIAAVGLALCSASVPAADYGFGVSAKSNDGWLYVPIDFSETFRLEPSIRYGKSDDFTESVNYDFHGEREVWEVGVGVFGLRKVSEPVRLYYGARLSYVNNYQTDYAVGPVLGKSGAEVDQDGFIIAPTLGLEYTFARHFSIAGEASYRFTYLDVDSTTFFDFDDRITVNRDEQSHETETRLIFRYMF